MKIKINWSLIIHPFLLAIFPPLFLLSHNIEQITAEDIPVILIVIAVTVGSAWLLWLLLSAISKDKQKAALIVSLALALFFSYGYFAPWLESYWKVISIGNFIIGHHKVLLAIWGIILGVGAYFSIRTRRNLSILTSLLNVVCVSLVVISLINIGAYALRSHAPPRGNMMAENRESGTSSVANLKTPPDIYYIILDAYAHSSTLQEFYNYDNSEFIDYLTEKNFFVASESHSNYPMTYLSLASSLNMEYFNNLADIIGIESQDRAIPYQMIKDNKVMNFLKSRGYKYIHFRSGSGPTNRNPYADLNITCGRYNEYLNVLIQATMAGPFMNNALQKDHAQTVLYAFSRLAELPATSGPKFVFAHILCPHPPYVFGVNGEPVPGAKVEMAGEVWEQKKLYLNQLIFITKKVKILVDEILLKSEVPPIIILQADHGPSVTTNAVSGEGWANPTKDMLRRRFSIFNAYYLPQNGDELLYGSITPVNTFRLIFNFYFGANYELLDDRCYFSSYDRPYEFTDVTDKVK